MKKKILVPVDFTAASDCAVKQAALLASRSGSSVTLFHVMTGRKDASKISDDLKTIAGRIFNEYKVYCDILVKEGNIFDAIPFEVAEKDYDLMIIGSHGLSGLKQYIFGTDILKLVSRISVPALVVRDDIKPVASFRKLLLPVSSHASFSSAIDAAVLVANICDAEIFLYSVSKPGFKWPSNLLENIALAEKTFEKKKIRYSRIREEQEGFSTGYASQTIRYAKSIDADLILMIPVASDEMHSFATAYKEAMLLNEYHIPVLCAGGVF